MLYIAYGSNLHKGRMKARCPGATAIGPTVLPNTRLVFRGFADVEPCEGAETHVGIWHITPTCERALDRYEGVSSGHYRKEYLPIRITRDGAETVEQALVYVMNSHGYYPPDDGYYGCIKDGYKDFGLPAKALKDAEKETRRLGKLQAAEIRAARHGELKLA